MRCKLFPLPVILQKQKKAAAELEKHLAILQQAEELALMGSWEYDLASGHLNWSEGMYKLFDLSSG